MKKCEKSSKICKMYELDGDFTSGMDHLSVFYEMEDNCDIWDLRRVLLVISFTKKNDTLYCRYF